MTHSEKEFAMMMEAMAEMTGTTLSKFMGTYYLDRLKPYGWQRVNTAILALMENLRRFPTVEDIKEAMGIVAENPITEEDEAIQLVGLIFQTISRVGGYNPKVAKERIGAFGWELIEQYGGWAALCNIEEDRRVGITAQMIKAARSQRKVLSDRTNMAPGIAESTPLQQALRIIDAGEG